MAAAYVGPQTIRCISPWPPYIPPHNTDDCDFEAVAELSVSTQRTLRAELKLRNYQRGQQPSSCRLARRPLHSQIDAWHTMTEPVKHGKCVNIAASARHASNCTTGSEHCRLVPSDTSSTPHLAYLSSSTQLILPPLSPYTLSSRLPVFLSLLSSASCPRSAACWLRCVCCYW